jgi:hypothetical protein
MKSFFNKITISKNNNYNYYYFIYSLKYNQPIPEFDINISAIPKKYHNKLKEILESIVYFRVYSWNLIDLPNNIVNPKLTLKIFFYGDEKNARKLGY